MTENDQRPASPRPLNTIGEALAEIADGGMAVVSTTRTGRTRAT